MMEAACSVSSLRVTYSCNQASGWRRGESPSTDWRLLLAVLFLLPHAALDERARAFAALGRRRLLRGLLRDAGDLLSEGRRARLARLILVHMGTSRLQYSP